MLRIIFRHITGSRATEVDVIPLGAPGSSSWACVLSSCAVRLDDGVLVGRYHARIAPSDEEPARLILADLKSRNGTFVNGAESNARWCCAPATSLARRMRARDRSADGANDRPPDELLFSQSVTFPV
jgi:hypothetical protein